MTKQGGKKFSYCPECQEIRWLEQVKGFMYRCNICEKPVNLTESKRIAKKLRAETREAKQKEMGTYESKGARKQRKEAKRRELDPEYVYFIHGFGCVVPGCSKHHPVHAHHVERRSQGGSDRTCIPLCPSHHLELHGKLGPRLAQMEWKVDFDQVIKGLNEAYDRGEKGPMHDMLAPFGKRFWRST